MVETAQSTDDIFNLIESKCISFLSNYKSTNYRECVSSLFYVAESLARYVLARHGYFPVSHEGIQVLLAQHFIKQGTLKKNVYNYLTNLYMRRKDADYKGFVDFDKDDVTTYWQWICEIVDDMSKFFEGNHKDRIYALIEEGNTLIVY